MIAALSFCVLALVQVISAQDSGYNSYIDDLVARHADYHLATAAGEEPDSWQKRLAELQSQHGVQDGQAAAQFPEAYWRELTKASEELQEQPQPEEPEDEEVAMEQQAKLSAIIDELDREQQMDDEEAADEVEYEPAQMNMINGEHKVSGGAGEGQQLLGPEGEYHNKPESKTNKLPSYCSPPNPCPKGFKPSIFDSPCEHGIINSKAFNQKYIWNKMATGECTCDTEHMHNCPHMSEGADADEVSGPSAKKRTAHFKSTSNKVENPWLNGVNVLDSVQKKAGPHPAKPEM